MTVEGAVLVASPSAMTLESFPCFPSPHLLWYLASGVQRIEDGRASGSALCSMISSQAAVNYAAGQKNFCSLERGVLADAQSGNLAYFLPGTIPDCVKQAPPSLMLQQARRCPSRPFM